MSKLVNAAPAGATDGFENGDGSEVFIVGNVYFVTPGQTAIEDITVTETGLSLSQPMYNVLGQRVNAAYKGIVIQNGHKFILK